MKKQNNIRVTFWFIFIMVTYLININGLIQSTNLNEALFALQGLISTLFVKHFFKKLPILQMLR